MVDALHSEYSDRVAFVLADLSTPVGRDFQMRTGVRETTLVFFDQYGRILNEQYGVPTEASLRFMIDSTFGLSPANTTVYR